MTSPEKLSADVPAEVKLVLRHLKPEPEYLVEERERLLMELEARIATAQGPVQPLLETLRSVLMSRRPGVAFQADFAKRFATALERFRQSSAAPRPPDILRECFTYLRDHLSATGLGPLLEAVDECTPEQAPPAWQARHTQELTTRIRFSAIRD